MCLQRKSEQQLNTICASETKRFKTLDVTQVNRNTDFGFIHLRKKFTTFEGDSY